MARLELESLKSAIATYVASAKVDLSSLSTTKDNIVGLVDTIGKIFHLEHNVYDRLGELDAGSLSWGKTVEEWSQDMTLPVTYDNDASGDKALKDYSPTYRPVSFSVTLGRKIFPTSIPYGNVERAVHDEGEFMEVVTTITKKLEDAVSIWKYGAKRQLLGEVMSRIDALATNATAYVASSTVLANGSLYKTTGHVGVAMKNKSASADDWATCVAQGDIVELDNMAEEIPVPEDTTTAEALIKAVKKAVEQAVDINEGNSFNGQVLGVTEGLILYIKQGVMPVLEVEALAGAFQKEELALPCEIKVIKDFGNYSGKGYALLMDRRAVKLFEGYNVTRDNMNGYGDRLNIFRHVEYTGHISRNAFFHEFLDD